ncbi:MAG TPA: hypothetical protein PLD53_07065 [Candidatus Propionivibrio aalborgensis]|nr:hypothetical protein [Candidatus Propionivibrio aalborgensis]
MKPQQVSRALAGQASGSHLAASLHSLFHMVGSELPAADLRRLVVKISRNLCSAISNAIRRFEPAEAENLHIVQLSHRINVRSSDGCVVLIIWFVFFVSVGFVHMVEPMVDHRLV